MPLPRIVTLLVLLLPVTTQVSADDAKQPEKVKAAEATVAEIVKKLRPSLATIRASGRDGGEHGIGNVKRPLVKRTDACQAPADLFHCAFDVTVRGANPVAHRKRTVQINRQASEKISQQAGDPSGFCIDDIF